MRLTGHLNRTAKVVFEIGNTVTVNAFKEGIDF